MRELQALCLDIAAYKVSSDEDTKSKDSEINLMEEFSETPDFQTPNNTQLVAEDHYFNYETPAKFFIDDKV